jgi:hypothetical protein
MKFLIALLIPALLVISVGLVRSRQAGDQSVITAEEYAVYAAVIGDMFAGDKGVFDTQSKVKILVIEDKTVSSLDDAFAGGNEVEKLKQEISPIISQETIDDYAAKNAKSHQLTKSLDLKLKYTLIPREKIYQIFNGRSPDEFYRQFPGSGGYIALSRVSLDSRGDQAFVYIRHTCGGLCGSGHYRALVKKNGEWVIQKKLALWIS